ncbi:MAG TPA: hypothetical protein VG097_07540 [Gemmata sp.]|nr:hypothetical protein [Gemmata sp.]
MKRIVFVAVVAFLAGCSNAPIAGFMDSCFPCKPVGPKPPSGSTNPIPPSTNLPPPDIGGPVVGPPTAPPGLTP